MNGGLLALGCVGAAQLMAQTALLRLLLSFTGGNELVIGWALAVWLVGGALGALLVRQWQSGFWAVAAAFALTLLLTAGAIPALFPPEPGAFVVEHPLRLLLNCCALFPVAFLGGMLFPLGLRLAANNLPRRYAADALGAICGGLLTLWLLGGNSHGGGNTGWLFLGVLVLLFLAPLVRRLPAVLPVFVIVWFFGGIVLGCGCPAMFPDRADRLETVNGFFQAMSQDGQTALYGNRQLLGLWPPTLADRELALLPPAFPAAARTQLQLGGSFSPLADQSCRLSNLQNTPVDPDARTAGIFRYAFNLGDTGPNFRNNYAAADPRRHLAGAAPVDVIIIAGGAPESIAGNRLFTTEFFTLARQRLTPGGVLAFALPVSENYLTPLQAQLVGAEVAALRDAGFTVGLYPMSRLLVVATPASALPAPETVLARLAAAGITDPELSSNFTFAAHPLRQGMLHQALASVPALPNTDARPLSGLLTLAAWLALFADDSNLTLPDWSAAAAGGLALTAICFFGAIIVAARRVAPARALAGAPGNVPQHTSGSAAATAALIATGAAAMTSHLLLMIVYQTRCGTLFHELGLLNAGFMLGGAFAAFARVPARLLPVLAAAVAAFAPLLLLFAPAPGLFTALTLIVLNGWSCGGLFLALAARLPDGSSRGYAADLAGAAPAALLALPLFVPLLSIPLTALLAALLALATLPVFLDGWRPGK